MTEERGGVMSTPGATVWYLNDKQVAARYSVSRPTVWRWAAAGVIPKPYQIGGSTLAGLEVDEGIHITVRPLSRQRGRVINRTAESRIERRWQPMVTKLTPRANTGAAPGIVMRRTFNR